MKHLHTKKHYRLSYVHVFLLFIVFYLYGITNFNIGQEINVPPSDAPIVIENEPQIIPDQTQEEIVFTEEEIHPAPIDGESGPIEGVESSEQSTEEILSGIVASLDGEAIYDLSGNAILADQFAGETLSGEILTGESMSGEILSGEILSGEILTGEILTGEMFLTGEIVSSGTGDILSGANQSGEIVSEENSFVEELLATGATIPEELTGIINPNTIPGLVLWLDASDYDSLVFDDNHISIWEDTRKNGMQASMSDSARRPMYETNIISGRPAIYFDDIDDGMGTTISISAPYSMYVVYNVQNPYLKNARVVQGLNNWYVGMLNDRFAYVASGGIVGGKAYASPRFMIAGLSNDGNEAHVCDNGANITSNSLYTHSPLGFGLGNFGFSQEEPLGGYIAEILVYDNSISTEMRDEMRRYFNTKYPNLNSHSLHTYTDTTLPEEILPIDQLSGEDVQYTGTLLTTTGGVDMITGEIEMITGALETGNTNIPEPILEIPEVIAPEPPIENTIISAGGTSSLSNNASPTSQDPIIEEIIAEQEEIVTGYFDHAYERGTYDEKIIQLQKLLTRLQVYTGVLDGVYSDDLIASIYSYQIQNGLLIGQEDNIAVRGYLGPKTRTALNQSYVEYQIYEMALQQQLQEQIISSGSTQTSPSDLSPSTGVDTILIPSSGQETLNQIGVLSGVNTVVLFDLLANPLLLSGVLIDTGLQLLFSGSIASGAYTSGGLLGVVFDTLDEKAILHYLYAQGYQTGVLTLLPVSSETLVGDMTLDFGSLSGKLLVPVILQSTNELSGQIAEVSIPEGTLLKTANGGQFTGELTPPVFTDPEIVIHELNQEVLAVVDVGSDEHIQFENENGDTMYATFRIPVPGKSLGDSVEIRYSEDGETRIYSDSVLVQDIDGNPYVSFEANHFTYFAIGAPVGTFSINNNESISTSTGVLLHADVPGASNMRFANTEAGLPGASWLAYAPQHNRNLLSVNGVQTVYAQFSGVNGIQSIQDSILLNQGDVLPTLRLQIAGNMNGTNILDSTANAYNFSGLGSITNPTISGEQVLSLNGTSQYAERGTIGLTTYPFTISARVNADTIAGTDAIVMVGNSATNTTYYGIQLTAGKPSIAVRNTTSYIGTSPEILVPGKRYHIVGVFNSATQRFIYVNGIRQAQNTSSVAFTTTNQQTRIGRYVGTTTNYFDGYIDDVRVYTTGLSTEQIYAMYLARAGGFERPIQYLNAGAFTINSGDSKTYTGRVQLISNVSGATHMRFGNTTGELTAASWSTYTGYSARDIDTTSSGNKIVYAQFSGIDTIRETQENIFFEELGDSSLRVLLDSSVNGTNILDRSTNAYHFSGLSSLSNANLFGETVLSFNGTSQYAQRGSINMTAYPFTFSARINADTIVGTDAIMMMGNSATTTTYYGIQLVNGAPSIVARNTTARTNTTQALATGQRYHIAGVFNSSTSRTLYLNGVAMVTATTTATFATTNQQVRIGRYVATATNYFDGYIDDSRIYARSLSSEEILSLYNQRETTTVVPTSNIIYNVTSLTSGDVIATLTGDSEGISISNNNGNASYTFTGNGAFTFMYQDSDGNIGSSIAAVDWIDKTPPNFAGVISGYIYPGNVTITFADDNLSGALLNGMPYISGTVISGQNTYEFIVEDTLGNRTGAIFAIDTNPPPIASVEYMPTSETITTGTVVATLTGFNKTGIVVTNNSGSFSYTFTGNGTFTFDFIDLGGETGSVTASVDRIRNRLEYSTTGWIENQGIDNGGIASTITVTLGTGSFAPTVANYMQIDNLPTGLTGICTLSGTNQVIISLSGNADNHMAIDSREDVSIIFLTGAFTYWNPSEVLFSTKTGVSIQFYDPLNFIPGQQLRINGGLSGGQFYDRSENHRATTGYGSISNSSRSGETVMGPFNGSSQYVTVGTYTLPNYSISARFNSSVLDANRRTIVGSDGVDGFEISKSTVNKIVIYYNTQLTSTTTIEANKRYHVVVVKDAGGTKLYINGVLEASNTYTAGLTNLPLAIGRWTTSQYRNGLIDEVKIYDTPLTATQIENLYMVNPSFVPKQTQVSTPNLRGLVYDSQMNISLTIDGVNYPATNNQDGTRQILAAGPFIGGTYDVQLNYTNIYGMTGIIYYTGGLIVDSNIYIIYDPMTTTSGNVTVTLTGYNEDTLIMNNGGSPTYIFTDNGQFDFNLQELSGNNFNVTAIVDWIQKASIRYTTGIFYENTGLNNGTIANTIVATLEGDTFSSNMITNGLIQMVDVPVGLTGVYTLSGNTQLIIGLTGNAINHTTANTTSGIIISFLTGAFVTYSPNSIEGSNITGIEIQFYDGDIIPGQQLRLKGGVVGTQFYDSSPNNHVTIGYNSIGNSLQSGETVMGPFNGTNQYIEVGNYALSTYTISAWFNSAQLSNGRRSILGDPGTSFEISQNPSNQIEVYGVITSNAVIRANERYHVVLLVGPTQTQLYINGILDNQNTTAKTINSPINIGRAYNGQYRNGTIDEVQIYDNPITLTQVETLYMVKPSFVPTTVYASTSTLTGLTADAQMTISLTINGTTYPATNNQDGTRTANDVGTLASGTYNVQLNYMNVYGRTGSMLYTGGLIVNSISAGTLGITGPVNFDFGLRSVHDHAYTLEKTFSGTNDYFKIIDTAGANTGYYTTISISNITNANGDVLPYSKIAVKALNGIITLSGTNNPRVYSAITGAYQYFTAVPLTFIKRDTAANGGVVGTYGLQTVWKLDVPILQNIGSYTGVITYTLY